MGAAPPVAAPPARGEHAVPWETAPSRAGREGDTSAAGPEELATFPGGRGAHLRRAARRRSRGPAWAAPPRAPRGRRRSRYGRAPWWDWVRVLGFHRGVRRMWLRNGPIEGSALGARFSNARPGRRAPHVAALPAFCPAQVIEQPCLSLIPRGGARDGAWRECTGTKSWRGACGRRRSDAAARPVAAGAGATAKGGHTPEAMYGGGLKARSHEGRRLQLTRVLCLLRTPLIPPPPRSRPWRTHWRASVPWGAWRDTSSPTRCAASSGDGGPESPGCPVVCRRPRGSRPAGANEPD